MNRVNLLDPIGRFSTDFFQSSPGGQNFRFANGKVQQTTAFQDRLVASYLPKVSASKKPFPLTLSYSGKESLYTAMNLAMRAHPYEQEMKQIAESAVAGTDYKVKVELNKREVLLEHLLVGLYMRQPNMIEDFLGKVEISELSNRLLGFEVQDDDIERLHEKPLSTVSSLEVTFSPDVATVVENAESIARLVGHSQVASAELFLSLLMFSKGESIAKSLIADTELSIDKDKVRMMYLETNVRKHSKPGIMTVAEISALN